VRSGHQPVSVQPQPNDRNEPRNESVALRRDHETRESTAPRSPLADTAPPDTWLSEWPRFAALCACSNVKPPSRHCTRQRLLSLAKLIQDLAHVRRCTESVVHAQMQQHPLILTKYIVGFRRLRKM